MEQTAQKWSKSGKKWISRLLFLLVACFFLLSFGLSQLQLTHTNMMRFGSRSDNTRLPSATSMAAIFLNYRTFAADLAWIQMIVDYGDQIAAGRPSINILHNGLVLAKLDPSFRHVYDWIPGAFFANHRSPTRAELNQLSYLMEIGQAAFPAEGTISYDNAVNYFSANHSNDADRIVDDNMAIKYLKESLKRPGTPELAAPLLEYFENHRAKLLNKYENAPFRYPYAKWRETYVRKVDRKPNVDQLAKFLLSTTDSEVASNLRDELMASKNPENRAVIRRVNELSHMFETKLNEDWRGFVGGGVFSVLVR